MACFHIDGHVPDSSMTANRIYTNHDKTFDEDRIMLELRRSAVDVLALGAVVSKFSISCWLKLISDSLTF